MRFETPNLEGRYTLVVEGLCPYGHGLLDRHDDCGWCQTCKVGWSIRGEVIGLHADPGRGTVFSYDDETRVWGWRPPVGTDVTDWGDITGQQPGPAPHSPDRNQP